jgi:hypothetical protein
LVVDGPFHGVYLRMLAKCIWKGEIMRQSSTHCIINPSILEMSLQMLI